MISLKLNSGYADLQAKQAITLLKAAGLLEFEALEPTISVPIALPDTERNRRLSGHLYRPASLSEFTGIPASLEFKGAMLAQGEFVSRLAQERKPLEGFFRADAGAVASAKERSIGEILENRTLTLPFDSRTDPSYPLNDPQYKSLESDIVFPEMMWRQKRRYFDNLEQELHINEPGGLLLSPSFKISYLLKAVFQDLGYTVYMDLESAIHQQAIMHSAIFRAFSQIGVVWQPSYKELLPKMSLSSFIRSCRALGFAIGINSQFREVHIKSLTKVFRDEGEDWTAQSEPFPEIKPAYEEGNSQLEYPQPPEVTADREVDLATQLGSGDLEEVVLVKSEGRYYQQQQFGNEDDGFLDWVQVDLATDPFNLDRDGFNVKSDFIPCPNSQTFYFQASGLRLRNNSGNTLLRTVPSRDWNTSFQIQVQEKDLGEGWYINVGSILNTVELSLPYQEDYDNVDIRYRLNLFRSMPDRVNEIADQPLISIYRGAHPQHGHQYADPIGLRWEELVANELADLKRVVEKGKQATFKVRPTPSQIAQFSPLKPIRIDGVRYIPKKLELNMGRAIVGELEGWIV